MGDQGRVVNLIDGYWYRVDTDPIEHVCCKCGARHLVNLKPIDIDIYWKWRLIDDEKASAVRDTGKPRKKARKEEGLVSKGKKEVGGDTRKHARGSKR